MTKTTAAGQQTVSDVDTNMMGIRSKNLYDLLKKVVVEGDINALNDSEPRVVLEEITEHLTVSIPEDIFKTKNSGKDHEFERLKGELAALGDYLKSQFQSRAVYPFTIVRICELCYDPFKYFKVYELGKFVGAITSCCLVKTSWCHVDDSTKALKHSDRNESDQEDVSLTKIPWIDEDTKRELNPFIKEIGSIMGATLELEGGDEDENMEVDLNEFEGRREDENFTIEGYYEDVPGREDDDDEDDEDYVEGSHSDEDEDSDDGEDQERAVSYGKRKPTEVDDFGYIEKGARGAERTTPKKLKAQTVPEQRPEGQGSSLEQQVSILISPDGKDQESKGNILGR